MISYHWFLLPLGIKYSHVTLNYPREIGNSPHSPEPRRDRAFRMIWILVWLFLTFRLWYASAHELAADEAVYWSWSRHLAGGYLDHPSMIAFLIHFSTHLFGSTEFGTRFFCPLMTTASLIIMLDIATRVLKERRAVLWVGIIWLTSPLLAALGTIITPDTPSIFFSLCAMTCVVLMFQDADAPEKPAREAGLWLVFGVFCGLAMWSKYTTVLLPLSVGLGLLTSPLGRRHLRRPWPWLSAIPAVAVFMPVLLWNRAHHWASFLYQLHHGLNAPKGKPLAHDLLHQAGRATLGLLRYSGNELLVWTPVLMVIGVVVLIHFWRRYRSLPPIDRMLLWMATFPLVFFAFASTRAQSEANWPIFAYFPLSLLTVRWLAEGWIGERVGWVRNGCIVSLIGLVVLQVPEVWGRFLPEKLHKPVMAKLDELSGWRELGKKVGLAAQGMQIVTEKHQDAAELAFYVPGQPDVWPVGDGSRAFAFDFFDPKPNFDAMDHVLFVGYHYQWFAHSHGLDLEGVQTIMLRLKTGGTRHTTVMLLKRASPTTQPVSNSPTTTQTAP